MKDIILKALVEDFADNEGFSVGSAEAFEGFVSRTILEKFFQQTRDEYHETIIGGGDDGGVDSIAILINGSHVNSIEEIESFVQQLRWIKVDFVFIQAKRTEKFESKEIANFIYGVKESFSEAPKIKFSAQMKEKISIVKEIYKYSKHLDQNPSCHLYYCTPGTWRDAENPAGRISSGREELLELGYFENVRIMPVDASMLRNFRKELDRGVEREIHFPLVQSFPDIPDVSEAYIGLLKGTEFLKLLTNDDGSLNRGIFVDNVRDFQGDNNVNVEIKETIEDEERRKRLALLNNGLTIVARRIKRTGERMLLSDYQIVNGCQTSNILFQCQDYLDEQTIVPIKLIVSDNTPVITDIIRSTNRQTEVKPEAMESLTEFHRELEDFYDAQRQTSGLPYDFFYERRSKQYAAENLKSFQVITLTIQTKSFISMFLNEPHAQNRYYGELISNYRDRLFVEGQLCDPYFCSGSAHGLIERAIVFGDLPKEARTWKYHIMLVARLLTDPNPIRSLNDTRVRKLTDKLLGIFQDHKATMNLFDESLQVIRGNLDRDIRNRSAPAFRLKEFTTRLISDLADIPQPATRPVDNRIGKQETGNILFFDGYKNFGFIEPDSGGENLFVHLNNIGEVPWAKREPGTRVEYTISQGRDVGTYAATSVRLANPN